MTIGEVAERFSVTEDTLRWYEKQGVIPPVSRTRSGLRSYSEKDIGWIELAICLRSAGLSIDRIAEYVRLSMEGDGTIHQRRLLLESAYREMAERKSDIDKALSRLEFKIERYKDAESTGVLSWSMKDE